MAQYIYTMNRVSKVVPPKRTILRDISLSFFPGAKIGVLGLNGSGKSSLLRIMAGVDTAIDGEARPQNGIRVGFLPQEPQLDPEKDVRTSVMEGVGDTYKLLERFNQISEKFSEPVSDDEMNALLEEQAKLQDAIDAAGGWELERKLEIAADALRLPPWDAKIAMLSGGEKRRVALCRLLLSAPDMLLLDETLINNNGFILGALVISVMYGIHAAYCLLCLAYGIRITQFSFFFSPFFKLHRRVINGVEFTLGWLPLGGYVKPLGYQATAEEMNEIKPEDRAYAVFSKPAYVKTIFLLIPFLVTLAAMVGALSVFKEASQVPPVIEIVNYFGAAIRAIFIGSMSVQDFIALTSATTHGSNIIAFALILILTGVFFSHLLGTLMTTLASKDGTVGGVRMILMMAIYLLFMWVILWKVPAFILSFITVSQALISLASFALGAFVTGVVLYFIAMVVAMLLPRRAVAGV